MLRWQAQITKRNGTAPAPTPSIVKVFANIVRPSGGEWIELHWASIGWFIFILADISPDQSTSKRHLFIERNRRLHDDNELLAATGTLKLRSHSRCGVGQRTVEHRPTAR
jgi:hypothetical protein